MTSLVPAVCDDVVRLENLLGLLIGTWVVVGWLVEEVITLIADGFVI